MKIQIASDLHLEFYKDIPRNDTFFKKLVEPTDADLLILAGDIGYPEDAITLQFLTYCCYTWPEVYWVFGNHEYYNKNPSHVWKYKKTVYTMEEKENLVPPLENLIAAHMHPDYEYGGIPILGYTFWTDILPTQGYPLTHTLADFTYIQQNDGFPLTLSEWTSRHAVARKELLQNLDRLALEGRKAIVVTHHLPTYAMILAKYQGSELNCGFAAHADDLVKHPGVALWICGHSHGQKVIQLEGTKIILNARGYPREDAHIIYNPKLTVDLSPSLCGASSELSGAVRAPLPPPFSLE